MNTCPICERPIDTGRIHPNAAKPQDGDYLLHVKCVDGRGKDNRVWVEKPGSELHRKITERLESLR